MNGIPNSSSGSLEGKFKAVEVEIDEFCWEFIAPFLGGLGGVGKIRAVTSIQGKTWVGFEPCFDESGGR